MEDGRKRVLIIGAGFAGIAAAKALSKADAMVTIFDRRNHHVFQPLLYQVATASLSPSEISASIRSIVSEIDNCHVVLAEVEAIDVDAKRIRVKGEWVEYDYLILAAGATTTYFGHDEWAEIAPGLKTLEDATELRRRILLAFESAEYEADEDSRRAALTFAIVGAGPTGVELAGAIKEIAARTLPEDFRRIDTRTTRVILFQGEDRVLPTFPEALSAKAQRYLENMGVEVRLETMVTDINPDGVFVGDEFIPVHNVFWAAGVRARPITETIGAELDKAGRVKVSPDLSVPGHPELFVVGDIAHAVSADTGKEVPGVAQGALQMGRFVGRLIAREIAGKVGPDSRPKFVYKDKGSMAVIGKNRAVADFGRFELGGFLAWVIWGGIHIAFLVNFRNRIQVMFSWFWNWLHNARDSRLIMGDAQLEAREVDAPALADHHPGPAEDDGKE